jgi:hypothetical protein
MIGRTYSWLPSIYPNHLSNPATVQDREKRRGNSLCKLLRDARIDTGNLPLRCATTGRTRQFPTFFSRLGSI